MKIDELKEYIEDLKCEQEELEECGDLEERFEMAQKIERHEELVKNPRGVTKSSCGFCGGSGILQEYDDAWKCGACDGQGGTWSLI